MKSSRASTYSGSIVCMYEEVISERTTSGNRGCRYGVACPKMMSRYYICWRAEPSRRRMRYHVENLLPLLLSIVLLVRPPPRLPSLLQTEAKDTETSGVRQSAAATNNEVTAHDEPERASSAGPHGFPAAVSTSSDTPADSDATTTAASESGQASAAETTNPTDEGTRSAAPSAAGKQEAEQQPVATSQQHQDVGTPEAPGTPTPAQPSVSASPRKKRVVVKVRKRHKKKRSSRRGGAGEQKRCFFLADSAFVSSAHLLPPPPPFTPPSTPDGRAFLRAVELCHVSRFNLNVGKKFVYLMSSAVTYFQQSRVKCAVAYAQIFREEDIPVASEDVLDACAVALLRHSPDDCWIDAADPRSVFRQGMPGTQLIEPPAAVKNSKGEPVDEAADARRRQFKRAERLTLTLFKFSLVSRCHWCPPYQKGKPSAKEVPTADLLPKEGYEGPKHEAWRKYLDALNEEVTRDLIGIYPRAEDDSAATHPAEEGDSGNSTIPTPSADAKDVFFSPDFNLSEPWKSSGALPLGGSWMSRGRTSLPEGEEPVRRAGGYTGLGNIPAGAVFGGLSNPISRYAALLSYLQSRYRFQRLKYEIEEESQSPRGDDLLLADPHSADIRPGTIQTLTLQRIDDEDPFRGQVQDVQERAGGRQFFTLAPSNARSKTRQARKQRSSCDLMPQDQAAEAAKAALACGADCVDTGEDLNKILRDGTEAPPSNFMDTFWSQNDNSVWPMRLPRHPTAESLQRAYLNQLVSGCGTSRIHLSEAEHYYFAQAASLHFFGRFHEKCLQAMDEMTLPLFMRAFADESRGRRVGMAALQEFLPVPAPYSGADQLLVNCAAAALVASAMPTTSLSNAAASAEAIAAAAAAAGAPTWGAPTLKTRAALAASASAYHEPGRGLTGRSKFTPHIPCWELDSRRLPHGMSQSEFRHVVTTFTDLEIRAIPLADRRFLEEQLVPTVLQSLLKEKLPVRIFLGYKSPAARAFVLARYMRARFKLDTPEEAGWEEPPPSTLSVEDQTIKAAEVAVSCGLTCTDTGRSVGEIIRNGLEAYRRRRAAKNRANDDAEALKKGNSGDDDSDYFGSEFELEDDTPIDEIVKDTPAAAQHKQASNIVVPCSPPPVEDTADRNLAVRRALLWISIIASLAAASL